MGPGEHVLFIHSAGTGPNMWESVPAASVGARPKTLAANIGYPPGPFVERGTTVTARDDAAHVLKQVPARAERVHLVAHSYGALVALHAIEALKNRVASVFFFEPVVFGGLAKATDVDPAALEQSRTFMSHPWFLTDLERGGRDEWMDMFIDYWNRPGSWSKMPEEIQAYTLMLGWKMFQEVRSCFHDEIPIETWDVPVPTTIAHGDRTTVASRAMSKAFAKGRDNVTRVEVAGVGHMAPLTHAEKVHEEIARHFARVAKSEEV